MLGIIIKKAHKSIRLYNQNILRTIKIHLTNK
jgi:hypothetical protein